MYGVVCALGGYIDDDWTSISFVKFGSRIPIRDENFSTHDFVFPHKETNLTVFRCCQDITSVAIFAFLDRSTVDPRPIAAVMFINADQEGGSPFLTRWGFI